MIRNDKVVVCYFLVEILVIFASVGKATAKECKKQNSCSVNISGWPTKLDLLYNLWCHVRWCSAEELDFLSIGYLSAEAKIYQLDVSLSVKHDVFKLDITMSYALRVQVIECTHELCKYLSCLRLVHLTVRFAL